MIVRAKVWNFVKPSVEATLASSRVAVFIADALDLPLVWTGDVARSPEDTLIIVNGPFAFCGELPALAVAIRRARRIVWVQNDYTIVLPKETSQGTSPFRAAFRLRHKAGLKPMTLWTTCLPLRSDQDSYVNWNSIFYTPLLTAQLTKRRRLARSTLLYYGAFREGRREAFDRYFGKQHGGVKLVISGASDKYQSYARHATIIPPIRRTVFYESLATYGLGLYLEDRKSHQQFHSPAARFYEMLASGLPMVFQPECAAMLAKANVDVAPYVVSTPQDVGRIMRMREAVGRQQRRRWAYDYVGHVRRKIRRLFKEL